MPILVLYFTFWQYEQECYKHCFITGKVNKDQISSFVFIKKNENISTFYEFLHQKDIKLEKLQMFSCVFLWVKVLM